MDRYQPPTDDQGSVPTQPSGVRTPTPPYSPGRRADQSPIQRYNEMQWSAVDRTPDGTPAVLPSGVARLGRPGLVRQRFSGSGLMLPSRAQRSEQRARSTTLALAGLAALLILGSALLLFQPTIDWPGFGFKLGQQFSQLVSNIPLIIQGTPPPVRPTPVPRTVVSTPTPHPGGPSTPRPTATAIPPTPTAILPTATSTAVPATATATPVVLPSLATVTFTSVAAQSETSNGSMNACPSGCDLPTQSTGGQASGQAYQGYVSGYISYDWAGDVHVTETEVVRCNGSACTGASWIGGNVTVTSGGFSCIVYMPAGVIGSQWNLGTCHDGVTSPNSSLAANSFSGGGSGSIPISGTVWTIHVAVTFYNDTLTSDSYNYLVTQGDCNKVTSGAYGNAYSNAVNAINQWAGGKLDVTSSVTQAGSSCSPAVGQVGGSVTGHATDNYSAAGYRASDAQNVASTRVAALLPPGYYWSSGPSTCSPSGGSWSGGQIIGIQCSDSGTASYDWRSGSQAQTNLKQQLAGQTNANALSICNSFPGVQPGSCSISYQGGNTQVMPSSPGQIQLNVQ